MNYYNKNLINLELDKVFIIHGEEDVLRLDYLDLIREKAKNALYLNKEIFIVDSVNFDWNNLKFSLDEQGLFGEKKILEIHIINGKPGTKGADFFVYLSKKIPIQDTLVIIFLPKLERSQIISKWFKDISSKSKVLEAKKIQLNKINEWVQNRLKKYRLSISEDALALFIDKVEGNLLAADQEIYKLSLILDDKKKLIDIGDIEKNVANVARYDIFQLSNTWMEGNLTKAIAFLDNLKLSGEDPIQLLWVITEDIRTLIKLKYKISEGYTIASVKNQLRLWGNKEKAASLAIKRISNKKLLISLQKCAELDLIVKGVKEEDFWLELKNLLVDLA